MKGFQIVSLTVVAFLVIRCSDAEPVATGYKKEASADAGVKPQTPAQAPAAAPNATPAPAMGPVVAGPAMGPAPAGPVTPPAGGGDAAKGNALMVTNKCTMCHPSKDGEAAIAKGKVLNKTLIPNLDKALSADNTIYHGGFKDVFAGQNRKDLEAALQAK